MNLQLVANEEVLMCFKKEEKPRVVQFRGMELLPQKLAARYLGISEEDASQSKQLKKGANT